MPERQLKICYDIFIYIYKKLVNDLSYIIIIINGTLPYYLLLIHFWLICIRTATSSLWYTHSSTDILIFHRYPLGWLTELEHRG